MPRTDLTVYQASVVAIMIIAVYEQQLIPIPKRLFQKHPFHSRKLKSETPGASKNMFLNGGGVLGKVFYHHRHHAAA